MKEPLFSSLIRDRVILFWYGNFFFVSQLSSNFTSSLKKKKTKILAHSVVKRSKWGNEECPTLLLQQKTRQCPVENTKFTMLQTTINSLFKTTEFICSAFWRLKVYNWGCGSYPLWNVQLSFLLLSCWWQVLGVPWLGATTAVVLCPSPHSRLPAVSVCSNFPFLSHIRHSYRDRVELNPLWSHFNLKDTYNVIILIPLTPGRT